MGCCFSSTKTSQHAPNGKEEQGLGFPGRPHVQEQVTTDIGTESRAPPPSDEESVKEVLSEIPISKPQIHAVEEQNHTQLPIVQLHEEKIETKGLIHEEEEVSNVSQVSEICSATESYSTTTTNTTLTEKRDDEAISKRSRREVVQARSNRSPAKAPRKRLQAADIASGRQRRSKSPAKRAESSPERKPQMNSRSIRGGESGQVAARKQNVGMSTGIRSVANDGSNRRSRSPAARAASGSGNVVRSRNKVQSSERTGPTGMQSPGKESVKEVWEETNTTADAKTESFDNPHVAMECFIFL